MLKLHIVSLFLFTLVLSSFSQDFRWQQRVEYNMDVRLDVTTHKVTGIQKLTYYNNSRDTLTKVFYHLYWNAFQPGSMMDVRSINITDPDARVGDRISKLKDDEIGYQHIQSLKQDGKDVSYKVDGTVLEVILSKPILPNGKTIFDMKFESQVPVQIRRSGRNNKEGIAYSMTQWYPKMAEYDFQGWHAYQYVGREFHSVWGDFDVKITIDPTHVIGGTGMLQNADKIGHGYEKQGSTVKQPSGDLTWHFIAKNVIDFAWASDPDFAHDRLKVPDGPELHFFYQKNEKTTPNWKKMQEYAVKHFQFMNKTFGKYPYESYSIVQGGDGGMEYPMCTLIMGEGSLTGLVGLMAHEVSHSWYQAVLASNEALYPWMDEGFTDFARQESMASMFDSPIQSSHQSSYASYFGLLSRGLQEPISQHADHYTTNLAYKVAAYAMGAIFLEQLKYIVGEENFYKGMRKYYYSWKFKHPEPNDFRRVMEKTSGMDLGWYMSYWINTNKTIDYGIKNVVESEGSTFISLERVGEFPMPVDLVITYKDGSKEMYYIPTNETLGNKPVEDKTIQRVDLDAWPWVYPTYTLNIQRKSEAIASIEIDPSQRMADVERKNNVVDFSKDLKPYSDNTK
ncbi:M1 family metallopeptidase [Chryseolinea sp. H1M3-3]|uniref:M1 family metallopeptidase n=1 Tax=Chryseolinea sp. H1M3-3 TaxID=3034144 RepID=UPI0023EA7F2A|nr:M1 family metallopeptidase [Chryseolinea sp. H1M3-3]